MENFMFNNYYFYIYQNENKMWAWRIQGANNLVIGHSSLEYHSYQDVINEIVKIIKINRWEKEEPDLYRVMLDLKRGKSED